NPEQVTKEAKAGEFVPKGAFMIYGKKNFVKEYVMQIAIGLKEGKVIGGPVTAIDSQTKDYVIVGTGDTKKSDLAKQIKKRIGGELDDIFNFLPGDGKIVK
ncbi:fibronectin-binding domain-containing protein, partial [Candidatus Woesearchaeota archaeon]|nr:fibronectin-binding domain-containing protein [Candidatus Woesearchaeota archaeon]